MNLIRDDFLASGIFGRLFDDQSNFLMYTLEHAFPNPDGTYSPLIPEGTYTCVRGIHHLDIRPDPFETFEITGVKDHTGLLFHSGNTNEDSKGCVIVGLRKQQDDMLIQSREALAKFMSLQQGQNSFILAIHRTIVGP